MYFLNNENGDKEEALKNISSAIQLDNDQPEYYEMRAKLYMEKKYWKEAVSDYDKFINSDRNVSSFPYFQRAIAKLWLEDKSACKDFQKAYSMAESEKAKEAISSWYKKYCR